MNRRQPRVGHVLVLPRLHIANVFELDETAGAAVMRTTARVARAVNEAFGPEGLSLWQSNGAAAFQEVPHFHMHVMPRWHDDDLLRVYASRVSTPDAEELEAQAAAVRAVISLR